MNDTWLTSDSQIIGRTKRNPHEQGTLWVLELPDGDLFEVILEKQDAGSVSGFCQMARDAWDERKKESEAKARQRKAMSVDGGGGAAPRQEAVQTYETATSFAESVVQQLSRATDELNAATKRVRELTVQVRALQAAKEALDAQEDGAEKRTGVHEEEAKE